ncbi:Hypothetical predicted protein [Mytilus galloprovincialis]|uniref:Ig-like domain-containing protein n=1 Tax=Mytilus galloprovincialis TaxID=29158 RepID=A0A8B6EPT2_MYTGA|nr:Hypothetical predicted protein [Mytilus galloprovincialis]
MKFGVIGEQFSDVRTTILDITGPIIQASSGLPIAAGIQTDLNCIAFASNVDIKLVWNCMNLQASKSVITNFTEHTLTLTFMPSSVHNGIHCSCTLQGVIHKYSRSTSIQLDIISAYLSP